MFLCTCIHTCSNTYTNARSCMCVGRYTPAYHDSTTSMVHVTYPNSTKCGSAVSHTQQWYCALLHLLHMLPPTTPPMSCAVQSACACVLSSCPTKTPTCSHVTLCAKAICTGTSAHVVSLYLPTVTLQMCCV